MRCRIPSASKDKPAGTRPNNKQHMSNATTERTGNGPSRRRSRGGRNRNRNRNHQQGRQGGENRSSNGSGQRGRRSRESRRPEPVKLTWWQKLLKAIGLYKEPSRSRKGGPKTSTRDTRSPQAREGRDNRENREPRPQTERRAPDSADVDSNRLYLGNLSYEVTESDLEELFKGVGSVRSVEIVYNRRTHRSKGYGFVDMMGTDEAKRAVEVLHDQFFMGRKLVVSGAKSKGPIDDQDDDMEEEASSES